LQVFFAIIASLQIGLWKGAKPTTRAYEPLCFDFSGWASAAEVERPPSQLQKRPQPP